MAVRDLERLSARAAQLEGKGLNGLDFLLVTGLDSSSAPDRAFLEVHFHTERGLAQILAAPTPTEGFAVHGGQRLRAGPTGPVRVSSVTAGAAPNVLQLEIAPIGDYSTYTLEARNSIFAGFDPIFSEIRFKFRPGCFSDVCDPEWPRGEPADREPAIDYLAKDYDSFRHTLMSALEQRIPGWEPSSEVDLGQAILSLFAAAADELSDFQDRVMGEAFFASARNRVSLARHARLMDYHVHQGNQAATWLAVRLVPGAADPAGVSISGLRAWTGGPTPNADSIVFHSRDEQLMSPLLNDLELYDWGGAQYALEAGARTAELRLASAPGAEEAAKTVAELIRTGSVQHLLVQEHLDPATGRQIGVDPAKRQLLTLRQEPSTDAGAPRVPEANQDPVTGDWYVRVGWDEPLATDFCFTKIIAAENRTVPGISLFHGNLIRVYHGDVHRLRFRPPGARLSTDEHPYETTRWGTICRLPAGKPLLYRDTPPRSPQEPQSTLEARPPERWHEAPEADPDAPIRDREADPWTEVGRVLVTTRGDDGAYRDDPWTEVISLVGSDEDDDHFAVETDELGRSLIRFGNGTNGARLPDGAEVDCWYQTGFGPSGNVGADSLLSFAPAGAAPPAVPISDVWNPFDVTGGRAPEAREEILRAVPEAYRSRQLRAVTLQDYAERACEVPGVSMATARYAWTGSWRAVLVTVDPGGREDLAPELRREIAEHLEVVRLIGDDVEIRGPRFVPLDIRVSLCARPDVWPRDVRAELEQEFSDGYTADGRPGFFHPDRWTFGQALHESEILGRIRRVSGVDHVLSLRMVRKNGGTLCPEVVRVGPAEIVLVRNDPDHLESGRITFDVRGGRR